MASITTTKDRVDSPAEFVIHRYEKGNMNLDFQESWMLKLFIKPIEQVNPQTAKDFAAYKREKKAILRQYKLAGENIEKIDRIVSNAVWHVEKKEWVIFYLLQEQTKKYMERILQKDRSTIMRIVNHFVDKHWEGVTPIQKMLPAMREARWEAKRHENGVVKALLEQGLSQCSYNYKKDDLRLNGQVGEGIGVECQVKTGYTSLTIYVDRAWMDWALYLDGIGKVPVIMVGDKPQLITHVKWCDDAAGNATNWHLSKPKPMTVVILKQSHKYPLAQSSLTMYCNYDAGIFGKKAHAVTFDDLTATCLDKA